MTTAGQRQGVTGTRASCIRDGGRPTLDVGRRQGRTGAVSPEDLGRGAPPWLESERMYDEALAELLLRRHQPALQGFRRLLDRDSDYRDAADLYEQPSEP
jgi:hypothetical protein